MRVSDFKNPEPLYFKKKWFLQQQKNLSFFKRVQSRLNLTHLVLGAILVCLKVVDVLHVKHGKD